VAILVCSFLESALLSSLLHPNIFLSTLSIHTINLTVSSCETSYHRIDHWRKYIILCNFQTFCFLDSSQEEQCSKVNAIKHSQILFFSCILRECNFELLLSFANICSVAQFRLSGSG
jgi:hypothetical protein